MDGIVSITGAGIICSIGNDKPSVLDSLKNGRSGIGELKYLKTVHGDIPVGEVKLSTEEMKRILGISTDRLVSRTSAMGAIALKEALADAGLTDLSGKRITLISGTTVGVMDLTEELHGTEAAQVPQGNECGRSTEEMAELAGLKDARCCTICTACSSALNAIMLGADMLKRGDADVVIAGGSEPLSRYHLNGFNSLMILDRERCRPFDATRAGLNLGEGAAFVVLEKDAANGQAYINGYANRCDAFHQTATSKDGDGAYLAMSAALKAAGLTPGDIKYINAHGTATPDNDASESAAFRRVFGDALPDVTSTKSYTGHTTSASGSIEAVICLLAMKDGFIPASLGWHEPMPDGIIPSAGRTGVELDYIMCNSFGFGGNDSSLILGKYPPCIKTEAHAVVPVEIIAHAAVSSEDELAELRSYVSPMESRRMGKLMKASLLAAYKAMEKAGIAAPDAIVAATSRGMLELSEQFLGEIVENGEEHLKPTLFMQSTHNTIGSAIAIRTKCHGYNITYSQGEDSLLWARYDAEHLVGSGEWDTVLLCSFDEDVADGRTVRFNAECEIYKGQI